ncbi:MAG: PDZ domain-containing protein [Actinomycetota bacterium]
MSDSLEDTSGSDSTVAPQSPSLFPRWALRLVVLIVVAGAVGSFVRVPYYSLGPGPSSNVLEMLEVRGATTYPSDGQLLLTTASVSGGRLSAWEAVWVWLDPSLGVRPAHDLVPAGVTDRQQEIMNFRDMERSKIDAKLAAFRAIGVEIERIPGAQVLTVVVGMPAEGKLEPGDVIVAIDDADVATPSEAVEEIQRRKLGADVRVGVRRGTARKEFVVSTVRGSSGDDAPTIGVTLDTPYRFPYDVDIDTRSIGGPSGGLVFALSIADAFTVEDLTRGHVVAVTGTIFLSEDGTAVVGPIGAVEEKVRSALRAGADVFLVPSEEVEQARRAAPKSLKVYGVHTLDEALATLRGLSAASS